MRVTVRYLSLLLAAPALLTAASLCVFFLVPVMEAATGGSPGSKNDVIVGVSVAAIVGAAMVGRWSGRRLGGGAEWLAPLPVAAGAAATLLLLLQLLDGPLDNLAGAAFALAVVLLAWSAGMAAVAVGVARLRRRNRSRAALAWGIVGGVAVAELVTMAVVMLRYPPSAAPRAYALWWLPATALNLDIHLGWAPDGSGVGMTLGESLWPLSMVLLLVTTFAVAYVSRSATAARR